MSDESIPTTPVDYSTISSAPIVEPGTNESDPMSVFDPTPDPVTEPEPTPVTDAPETFVEVNLGSPGNLRVRDDAGDMAEVVGKVPNGDLLKVLSTDNPEWTFVESTSDGKTVRGYVKSSFVVPAAVPAVE